MNTKTALAAIVFATLLVAIVGLRVLVREASPETTVVSARQRTETSPPEPQDLVVDSIETADTVPTTNEDPAAGEDPGPTYAEALEAIASFVEDFSEAHNTRDADFLIATLDPAAIQAYGAEACNTYVAATAGSINSIELLAMGEAITYSYDTDSATTQIPGAWPVQLSVLVRGEPQILSGHFMYDGGAVSWLTRCDQ
jgi:hypothetical protein